MSARTNRKKSNTKTTSNLVSPYVGKLAPNLPSARERAWALIQKNDYAGAANLLAAAGRDIHVRNALGVCLMRSGRIAQAVDVYRSFVLMPGSVIERPDVSNACKRNFATALLMRGFPSGALAVLHEIHEPEHIMEARLRSAIKKWEKSLPWLRRLDWKLNRIEPSSCHVPLDFEPGEFDIEVSRQQPVNPNEPSKTDPKVAV